MKNDAVRADVLPMRAADRSVRRARTNTITAAISAPMPNRPAVARPAVTFPCRARNASASTGTASLAKLLKIPETSSASVITDRRKPHEWNIAYVMATAR